MFVNRFWDNSKHYAICHRCYPIRLIIELFEELEQLKFIPTISEFVEWIQEKWHNLPAFSDTVSTCTYLLNSLGLQKGDIVAILDNATPDTR
jgi:hypothetical protein